MIHTVSFNITTTSGGAYDSTTTANAATVTGLSKDQALLRPGLLYKVEWVDGDLADGVDATLSVTSTSGVVETLLTLTNANDDAVYYPQILVADNTGTATTFYTPQLVYGVPKLVVASGGDTKSGKLLMHLLEA